MTNIQDSLNELYVSFTRFLLVKWNKLFEINKKHVHFFSTPYQHVRTIVSVLSYPLIQSIHIGVTWIYRLYTAKKGRRIIAVAKKSIDRRHVVNVIHLLYSRTSITRIWKENLFFLERFNKREFYKDLYFKILWSVVFYFDMFGIILNSWNKEDDIDFLITDHYRDT